MTYFNLFLIAFIVVFIVDNTDFMDTIKKFIWKRWIKEGDYRNLQLKPFDCSLCGTWWLCLAYLIIFHKFTLLTVAFTALLSFLTPQIKDLQNLIADTIQLIINFIYTIIEGK